MSRWLGREDDLKGLGFRVSIESYSAENIDRILGMMSPRSDHDPPNSWQTVVADACHSSGIKERIPRMVPDMHPCISQYYNSKLYALNSRPVNSKL